MLFSSNVFLFLFLPVTLLGYQMLGRFGRVTMFSWLSLASLFFYGYWNPKYLLLLIGSIALNFIASRLIVWVKSEHGKTTALVGAVIANLALLGWFKYLFPLLGFFHRIGWLGHNFGRVLLPLGISFFTFTQIAYLIDLKQEMAEPQDLLSYVLFVTFFPHLIAGPIIHHSEMMPQFNVQPNAHPNARRNVQPNAQPNAQRNLDRTWGLRADDMAVGTTWFLMGLGKKVLIADRFGPVADALWARPGSFGAQASWVGVLCYAVQLYFDFSGYSDMALGLARMFSLTFPVNFNSPYKSRNIIDFWQTWHMTLTRYLNLYLYNPLALNMSRRRIRSGKKASRKAQRTLGGFSQLIALPLLITMFLAGVWHGAGLQFILFGLAHAVYLMVNHAWRTFVPEESPWQRLLPLPVSVLLTFACVLVGQIFFRAPSSGSAVYVMGTMLGLHGGAGLAQFAGYLPSRSGFAASGLHAWTELALMGAIVWALPNTQEILGQVEESERFRSLGMRWLRWQPNFGWAVAMLVLTAATLTMLYASTSFLYFQF
jgi:alginate O-acetyltransferase complex protein AlgI